MFTCMAKSAVSLLFDILIQDYSKTTPQTPPHPRKKQAAQRKLLTPVAAHFLWTRSLGTSFRFPVAGCLPVGGILCEESCFKLQTSSRETVKPSRSAFFDARCYNVLVSHPTCNRTTVCLQQLSSSVASELCGSELNYSSECSIFAANRILAKDLNFLQNNPPKYETKFGPFRTKCSPRPRYNTSSGRGKRGEPRPAVRGQ